MSDPRNPSTSTPTELVDLSGSWLGRYRVLEKLGRGGMGEVYLAEDVALGRQVALKRVAPELASDEKERHRAIKEAKRAALLADPRIAQIYDVIDEGGQVILVLEYVPGKTLRERLREPIPIEECWEIAIECAAALDVAHREGVLHRDIKPENIIITPGGHTKILDFGIARRLHESRTGPVTTEEILSEVISGTPPYMSPEALLGRPLDARSDIFSLGVVLYEMLAGSRPFTGQASGQLVDQILHAQPPPLTEAGVPISLALVVERMLEKDPDRRHETAEVLLEALAAAHRGGMDVPTIRLRKYLVRRKMWAFLLVPILIGVVLLVIPEGRLAARRAIGLTGLPEAKRVAILPFSWEGGDEELNALAGGLHELNTERLYRTAVAAGFFIAPAGEIDKESVDKPESARAELGANLAIATRFEPRGTEVELTVELIDTERLRVLDKKHARTEAVDSHELLEIHCAKTTELLDIPAEAQSRFGYRFSRDVAAGTLRFYAQGLGLLRAATDSVGLARAEVPMRRAVTMDPEFAMAWSGLGRLHLARFEETADKTDLALVEDNARKALGADAGLPEAHWLLGQVYQERKALEDAERAYRAALECDSTYALAYQSLSEVYEAMDRRDDARRTLERAVEVLPRDYRPLWWLGYFHFQQGEDAEALDAFLRLTKTSPDYHLGYGLSGAFLVQSGQYVRASEVLQKCIRLKPGEAAFSNLGTSYFLKRDFEQAIAAYQEAIGLGFSNYRMWYNLGEAYYWAPGQREYAEAAYRQALVLGRELIASSPDDAYVRCEMADLFPKLGEPDSARAYLEAGLALRPENPYVQEWAALVSWQLGERERALDWLQKAVEGGYSRTIVKDSAVFDDWREEPKFQDIVGDEVGPGPADSINGAEKEQHHDTAGS